MDRRRAGWAVAAVLAAGVAAAATQGPPAYVYTGAAPSGACTGTRVWIDALGSGTYYCNAGTWAPITLGNASTATALATNPTDCGAGTKATAIDASGNLTCSAVAVADLSATGTPSSATPRSSATRSSGSSFDSAASCSAFGTLTNGPQLPSA